MKKIPRFGLLVALLLVAVLTVAALPAAVLALANPIACYGDVTLDTAAAPVGTVINIYIGTDVTATATTTVTTAGQYGPVQVWEDDSRHGEALSYTVNGFAATTDPASPVFGWANQEVDLTAVSGPQPPQVTTNAATGETHNSATLNGNLDIGGYTSVNVYFQYGLTAAYGSTSGVANVGASGAFSQSIGGLTPSTTYHFRAVADTVLPANSVSDLGGDLTFTTSLGPDWPHDVSLGTGLNIISTPIWLDSASDTVSDIIPPADYNGGYRWTGTSFASLSTSYVWKPLEAFYVDVDAGTTATFVPTTDMKAPNTRVLQSNKWYLIGSSPLDGFGTQTMDVVLAGLANNWVNVVKPPLNQAGGSCTLATANTLSLSEFEGALVFVGAGTTRTIVGFCTTPLEP